MMFTSSPKKNVYLSFLFFLRHLHLPLLFSACPNSRHHQDSGVQCLPLLRHHSFILINPMKFGVDQFSTQLKCTGEGIKELKDQMLRLVDGITPAFAHTLQLRIASGRRSPIVAGTVGMQHVASIHCG